MKRRIHWFVLAGIIALAVALAFAKEEKEVEKKVFLFSSGGSWLGVGLADVDSARSKELGMKEERGAEIQSVVPESPAAEAGLKLGDVILEYHGTRIEGVAQLTRLVRETPAGRTVTLEVWRDRAARAVQVKVGERDGESMEGLPGMLGHHGGPREFHIPPIDIPDIHIPEMGFEGRGTSRLGATIETLTEQLGDFFGVKNGEGVLVRSVKKGSAGEAAGLRAGDVIVKVDKQGIGDASDLRLALRDRRGKDVALTIVRDKREQTLNVKLPKDDSTENERRSHAIILREHGGDAPVVVEDIDSAHGEVAQALHQAAEELKRSFKQKWVETSDDSI
jgi:S1-C subfamily serine protease